MRRSLTPRLLVLALLAVSCGKATRSHGDGGAATGGSGGSHAGTGGSQAESGGAHSGGADSGGSSGEGATAGTGDAGATAGPEPSSVDLTGSPIYTRVQRLTNSQWDRAVTDILRLSAPPNLAAGLPSAVAGTTDFTNNEKVLFVDGPAALDFELASEAAAALATGSAEALAALHADTDRDGFVRSFGRRAFRRPLTTEEEAKYQNVFTLGETIYGAGFAHGAALVIRAMLQSPHFLYRTELAPTGEPLNGYEVASKVSFWLLGTTPSDALLDAAADGSLDTPAGLEAAAREMLEQPAAVAVMRDFHGQLYQLDRYAGVGKSGVPEFDAALNPELAEASYRFFDAVFEAGEGLPEILTSPRGFVGPGLAPLYAIEPIPEAIEERDLGASRLGYFMQVPFLLLHGSDRESDPGARDAALQSAVLCAAESFNAVGPLGVAFENYDGMGQERASDDARPTAGSYPLAEGVAEFADAKALMQVLAGSEQAHTCYAKKLSGYALQRDIVESDRPLLGSLATVSLEASIRELVIALVRDPAFRTRQEGTP